MLQEDFSEELSRLARYGIFSTGQETVDGELIYQDPECGEGTALDLELRLNSLVETYRHRYDVQRGVCSDALRAKNHAREQRRLCLLNLIPKEKRDYLKLLNLKYDGEMVGVPRGRKREISLILERQGYTHGEVQGVVVKPLQLKNYSKILSQIVHREQ